MAAWWDNPELATSGETEVEQAAPWWEKPEFVQQAEAPVEEPVAVEPATPVTPENVPNRPLLPDSREGNPQVAAQTENQVDGPAGQSGQPLTPTQAAIRQSVQSQQAPTEGDEEIGSVLSAANLTARGAVGVVSGSLRAIPIAQTQRRIELLGKLDKMETTGKPDFRVGDALDTQVQSDYFRAMRSNDDAAKLEIRAQLLKDAQLPQTATLFRAGDAMDNWMRANLRANPTFEDSLTGKFFQGLGSMTGFMAATLALRSPVAALGGRGAASSLMIAGGLGAAVNGSGEFQTALAEGASVEEAIQAFNIGAAGGLTEGVPIASILNRVDKATSGGIKKALRDMVIEGTEEAAQESFQAVLSHLIATKFVKYNPDRKTWEMASDAAEGGFIGFTTGSLMSLLGSLFVGGRKGRGQDVGAPGEAPPVPEGATEADDLIGRESQPAADPTVGGTVDPTVVPVQTQGQQDRVEATNRILDGDAPLPTPIPETRDLSTEEQQSIEGVLEGLAGPAGAEPTASGTALPPLAGDTTELPQLDETLGPVPVTAEEAQAIGVDPDAQLSDARMKRSEFRERLTAMGNDLAVGGGGAGAPIRDENDRIVGRVPSVNPEWFQRMAAAPETKVSVARVPQIVEKALAGKEPLGVREARIVGTMLDEVSDQRGREVDHARDQLQAARQARRQTRPVELDDIAGPDFYAEQDAQAGEQFEESEYGVDWTADTRTGAELVDQASQFDNDAVEAILSKQPDTPDMMRQLWEVILNGRRATEGRPDASGGDTEAVARPEPVEGAPTEAADTGTGEGQPADAGAAGLESDLDQFGRHITPDGAVVSIEQKPDGFWKANVERDGVRTSESGLSVEGMSREDAIAAAAKAAATPEAAPEPEPTPEPESADVIPLRPPEPDVSPEGEQDLLGEVPAKEQAQADAERDVRDRLGGTEGQEQPPVEADEGLFSGGEKQTDIADAPPVDEPIGEGTALSGAKNTVFTEDKAEAARKRLKEKLGRLNAGYDPEMIADMLALGGFHFERGLRGFVEWSAAMIDDLGDGAKPYLKLAYNSIRDFPGLDTTGITPADQLDEPPPASEGAFGTVENPDLPALMKDIAGYFDGGGGFKNINAARKYVGDLLGGKIEPGTPSAKMVDEVVEAGAVMAARAYIGSPTEMRRGSPEAVYNYLVDLNSRMPNLSTRTSGSIARQAFSTPLPLAYLASRFAQVDQDTTVYEPTAGNGALLLEANTEKTWPNELDEARAEVLRGTGFANTTTQNAARPGTAGPGTAQAPKPPAKVDRILANPPFGALPNGSSGTATYYSTTQIDHVITMRALENLKDDGRAVLIVGAPRSKSEKERSAAYNGRTKRAFYFHLNQKFNVTNHFTVAGDLYARQGTTFPVDVIVIDGKRKVDDFFESDGRTPSFSRPLPAVQPPKVYTSWDELRELLDGKPDTVDTSERPGTDDTGVSVPAGSEEGGRGGLPGGAGTEGAASGGEVSEPGGGDGQVLPDTGGPGAGGQQSGKGKGSGRPADSKQPSTPQPPGGTKGAAGEAADLEAERPRTQGAEGGQGGSGGQADVRGERSDVDLGGTEAQTPYKPSSKKDTLLTLTPANMNDDINEALKALKERVGDVDAFVHEQLGYGENQDIGEFFGAEQVDALALAIDSVNRDRGFVIGDQTGIGKGRVVAGMIRYAIKNGLTPVFMTEKPNLYGDMYRDLRNIGMEDIRPMMTNASQNITLAAATRDSAGKVVSEEVRLKTPAAPAWNAQLRQMIADNDIGDFNMVFTTYSQSQALDKQRTDRMDFLEHFVDGGMFIMDEAHNAGGTGAATRGKKEEADLKRSATARRLVGLAKGVMYSSATWAKRPNVMDLYWKTDMVDAVGGNPELLPAAIAKGGIPLQQVVSAMLARVGQYIRRERGFKGVEYNTEDSPVDKGKARTVSDVMMQVAIFDELRKPALAAIKAEVMATAATMTSDGSTGAAGMNKTTFTGLMHNLVDQMLLSLKAKDAVDKALTAIERGEKPLITVSNTMGSFIKDFAKAMDLKPGDAVDMTFGDLMQKYLDRSRTVTIKDVSGNKRKHYITDSQLAEHAPSALRKYNETTAQIKAGDFSGMPVSPIDWMRGELERNGLKTSEITGRTIGIDYTKETPVLKTRPGKESSIAGKQKTIADFNHGRIDAVILNQSGASGLSLHASKDDREATDRRRRHMIIAQAEKNVDTHMQMLGRVHRTGQVIPPSYSQLVADIPAEKRPAAVLAQKMASLNATTTASRKSDFTAKSVVDFMNEEGDAVVALVMEDMPEIHAMIGRPLGGAGEGLDKEGAARKVSGRLPLLTIPNQELIYGLIEEGYRERIEQLDAMGLNPQEAKTLKLDAKTESEFVIYPGVEGGTLFSGSASAEVVDVKRLGKPFSSEKVVELIAKSLDTTVSEGASAAALTELQRTGEVKTRQVEEETRDEYRAYRKEFLDDIDSERARNAQEARLRGVWTRWHQTHQKLKPGTRVQIITPNNDVFWGIVGEIEHRTGAKLPIALGSWKVRLYVADSMRQIIIPFSQIGSTADGRTLVQPMSRDVTGTDVLDMFDEGQSESREKRVIVTGNLLAGFSQIPKGQIVLFENSEGVQRNGILMPRNFDLDEAAEQLPVTVPAQFANKFFEESRGLGILETADGNVRLRPGGGAFGEDLFIDVNRSKAQGGKYFQDQALLDLVGEFTSSGDVMKTRGKRSDANAIAAAIERIAGEGMITKTLRSEARRVTGQSETKTDDPPDPPSYSETWEQDWLEVEGGVQHKPEGLTVEAAEKEAVEAIGEKALRRLKRDGLRIVAKVTDLPQQVQKDTVRGVHLSDGRTFLVAENLAPGQVEGVLLHEIGVHYSKKIMPEAQFQSVLSEVERLLGAGHARVKAARAKVPENVAETQVLEETLAYLVEDTKNHNIGPVRRFLAAIRRFLFELGVTKRLTADSLVSIARANLRRASRGKTDFQPGNVDTQPAFSENEAAEEQRIATEDTVKQAVKDGQPIDAVARAPWRATKMLADKTGATAGVKKMAGETAQSLNNFYAEKMPWLKPVVNNIGATFVDRFGLDEKYKSVSEKQQNDKRAILNDLVDIIEEMGASGINDAAQAKVFYEILTEGKQVTDERWNKLGDQIRNRLTALGERAVKGKLITRESFERNKGAYLHRVYREHEERTGFIASNLQKIHSGRQRKIIGNELRGRGIFKEIKFERLLRDWNKGWWGVQQRKGLADTSFKGETVRVVDLMEPAGLEGVEAAEQKIKDRRFQPEDAPIPDGYTDKGTFEVRAVRGGGVVLWRDYTKAEREKMGEIMHAKYQLAKTFRLLAHDLTTGEFHKTIFENDAWTWKGEGEPPGDKIDASATNKGRWTSYGGFEWVKVPDTVIPETGGVRRWGALAGQWVRAEVYRDLVGLDQMHRTGFWSSMLRTWKVLHTALNPVVHVNNVMSNLLLMDMADVRFSDLYRAIQSMRQRDDDFREAELHGTFGHSFVEQEIQRDILDPIMKEMQDEVRGGKGFSEALLEDMNWLPANRQMAMVAKVMSGIYSGVGVPENRAGIKKLGVKPFNDLMTRAYQKEDEVFRLAAYMRFRSQGMDANAAATRARDQFLNYDIRAPGINALRGTVMPFLSYTYRAIPVVAGSLYQRPWKVAKYVALAAAWQAISYAVSPGDEEEERRLMREEEGGNVWLGFPRMLRTFYRDAAGNPIFIDVRRWIPAGDVFDTHQGQAALPYIPAPLIPSGPIVIAAEFLFNKQLFTGQDITDELVDTEADKIRKTAEFFWRSWMPNAPWIPYSWSQDRIVVASRGGRDTLGRKYSVAQAIANSFGVKLKPNDLDYNANIKLMEFNRRDQAIRFALKTLEKDNAANRVSQSYYNRMRATHIESLKRLKQQAQETFKGL